MATVIDELVVLLGLDPTKFTQGQKEAVSALNKMREASEKHGKETEKNTEKLSTQFSKLQRNLLGIAALFTGGLGLTRFTEQITKLTAELGRLSQQSGTSAQDLSQWIGAGSRVGATADEIAGSVLNLRSALERFRITGQSPIVQYFNQMGIGLSGANGKLKDTNQLLMEMSKWAQGRDKAFTAEWFREMGMSQGMINLLQQGPDKLAQWLREQKKLAPSDADIRKLQELQEIWAKMANKAEKLGRDIVVGLVPALEKFAGWVEKIVDFLDKPMQPGAADKAIEDQNKRYGPDAKSGWENLKEWWRGGGVGRTMGKVGDMLGPSSAHAALSPPDQPMGSSATASKGGVTSNAYLQKLRESRIREINNDPQLKEEVLSMLALEESKGNGRTAAMEALLNRSVMTGNTIKQELHSGFYSTVNSGRTRFSVSGSNRAASQAAIDAAAGGSNLIMGRTDQGMVGDPNAAGPGRVRVPGTSGIFNFWTGTRNGRFFSHSDSARFADELNRGAATAQTTNPMMEAGRPGSDIKLPWISEPAVLGLLKSANVSTTNNRTSNEVHVGEMSIHTQATDAYGIARDLKPALEMNKFTNQSNYGPN